MLYAYTARPAVRNDTRADILVGTLGGILAGTLGYNRADIPDYGCCGGSND